MKNHLEKAHAVANTYQWGLLSNYNRNTWARSIVTGAFKDTKVSSTGLFLALLKMHIAAPVCTVCTASDVGKF